MRGSTVEGHSATAKDSVVGSSAGTYGVKVGFLPVSRSRYGQSCAEVCEEGAEWDLEWGQQECVASELGIRPHARTGHAIRTAKSMRAVEMAPNCFTVR